jgi:hypothetical protein
MMYCPECGADLNEVPVGDECPKCGSDRRSAAAAAFVLKPKLNFPQGGFKVERSDHRPWTEKWMAMLLHQRNIEEAYRGRVPPGGNLEVESSVNSFCVECHNLPEWLEADVGILSGAKIEDIRAHRDESEALKAIEAVANSYKHHTRFEGTKTARIRETTIDAKGARVVIDLDWGQPDSARIDALDLVNRSVASWRGFFERHGIEEP